MTAGTGTHKIIGSTRSKQRDTSVTKALVGLWLCADNTGSVITDSSGNNLDVSPLYAPLWRTNTTYLVQRFVTPLTANGFYYECTTTGTTSATTEPAWPVIAGNTVTDGGTLVWTCRAVPDFWSANAGYVTMTNAIMSPLYTKQKRPNRMYEFLRPVVDGNISYTANTISAAATDNSISDSASSFPTTLVTGDWIQISGFTGDTANNTIAQITGTPTNAKISFTGTAGAAQGTGINTLDAAGETVTIRKVLPPLSLVFRFTIIETMNASGAVVQLLRYISQVGTAAGIQLGNIPTGPRQMRYQPVDLTGTSSSHTSVAFLGSGSVTNMAIVINRGHASGPTIEYFFAGVRDSSIGLGFLTKRQQCDLVSTSATGEQVLELMVGNITGNGATALKNIHLYIGRNLPADLTGITSPTLILLLNSTPTIALTAASWPSPT